MFALLTSVSGARAQITVSPSTGVYWKNGAATSDAWAPQWKSNALAADRTTPLLVFTGETGMNTATGDIYSNQAYTLEVPAGYFISSYTFNGTATGGDVTITPSGESGTTITSGNSLGSPLDVTVRAQSTSFALSGSGHIESLNLTVTVSPIPVVLACSQGLPNTFGSFSGQTYTTSDDSNLAGVTVTASTGLTIGQQTVNVANYGNCFKLETAAASTDYTVTMTAPTGYVITGYYIAGSANTKDAVHTLTSEDGSVSVVVSAPPYNTPANAPKVFEVTGLNANSTYFTINTANKANTLYLPKFIIYVAKASEVVAVTYNVVLGASGTVKATTTNPQVKGSTITLPAALTRDYCTYTYYTDAACTNQMTTVPNSGSATVYALASVNLPFTVSTDFANATWYYVNAHATYNNRFISTNGDAIVWGVDNGYTDAYKWAFIGNPYDGFQVINKAAGNGKYLQETDPLTMGTTAKAWPVRQQTNTSWHSGANGFGLWSDTNSKYVNTQGSTLKYWGSFDQGSTYWVTEVPTVEVNVTYDLYVGGEKVNTVVEEHVAENSAVNVPASLTANYSTLAYDFSTSGTIGNTDCTITVTATLKSGIVQPAELSNSKKYKLTTSTRGSLSTYTTGGNTYLASPVKTSLGVTAKEFAIINYNNNLYLYSVDDQKFVTYQSEQIAPLANMVSATDAVSFSQTTNSVYEIRFDNSASKILNSSASYTYGIVINGWGASSNQWDDGCQYIIEEVGDFDPTQALNALNGPTAYSNIIAALKAVNWGLTSEGNHRKVGYYNFTSNASADIYAYSGNEMAFLNMLEAQGYSAERLQVAQSLNVPGAYALNSPAAGFYRIQGHGDANSSNKYLAAGMANNKFAMSDATDATTIFYYDGTKLTNLSSGMCNGMTASAWAWTTGAEASTVTFGDGGTNGGYSILSNNAYFYDGGTSADRGSSLGADGRYRNWRLTEVTSLPVTISSVGYATLYAPVALTIPSGVTAYIATVDDKTEYLSLVEVENGVIPAETGVILAGAANTYDFDITTGGSDASNVLEGTAVAIARPADSYILATGSNGVGLYQDGATVIPGFKAYLPASAVSNARGFLGFSFGEVTAITAIEAALNSGKAVYDLNGRRVENPSNGVYIVNGKKVIINKK